jgi:hypothetical protein
VIFPRFLKSESHGLAPDLLSCACRTAASSAPAQTATRYCHHGGTVVRSRSKSYNRLTFGHDGAASGVWGVAREIVTNDRLLATRLRMLNAELFHSE